MVNKDLQWAVGKRKRGGGAPRGWVDPAGISRGGFG